MKKGKRKTENKRNWKMDSHTGRITILCGAELEVCCLCFLPLSCRIKVISTSSCLNWLCIGDCFSPITTAPENHQSSFFIENFWCSCWDDVMQFSLCFSSFSQRITHLQLLLSLLVATRTGVPSRWHWLNKDTIKKCRWWEGSACHTFNWFIIHHTNRNKNV